MEHVNEVYNLSVFICDDVLNENIKSQVKYLLMTTLAEEKLLAEEEKQRYIGESWKKSRFPSKTHENLHFFHIHICLIKGSQSIQPL